MTSADVRRCPCKADMRGTCAASINAAQRSFGDLQAFWGTIWCPSTGQPREEIRMSKDGLCAIVTGSASGLGAATAAMLAKGGARIVINYSSSQREAEQTADVCRAAGGEAVVVQGDVSRDEDCREI